MSREKNSPKKKSSFFLIVSAGPQDPTPGDRAAPFAPTVSAARLHQTGLGGPSHPTFASVRWLRALHAAPQKLVRAPCRPLKATRSRRCRRPSLGRGSTRGRPRCVIPYLPAPILSGRRGRAGGQSKPRGREH